MENGAGRIVNGELAGEAEFPYVVSIIRDSNQFLCNGFIYNAR